MLRHLVGFFLVVGFLMLAIGCWTVFPVSGWFPARTDAEWLTLGCISFVCAAWSSYMLLSSEDA